MVYNIRFKNAYFNYFQVIFIVTKTYVGINNYNNELKDSLEKKYIKKKKLIRQKKISFHNFLWFKIISN